MNKFDVMMRFPNLTISEFKITSPHDENYNCIAWAANEEDVWWWPHDTTFWPSSAPCEETLDAFVKAYESLGYAVCNSSDLEPDFEKIAIYTDSAGTPTHAARQLETGFWTSKLGKAEDIEHHTLKNLSDSLYGQVALIMKRQK